MADQEQTGYRAKIPERCFWKAVGELEPGKGIEIFIGRESSQESTGGVTRSLLRRCTHYVLVPKSTPVVQTRVPRVPMTELSKGNSVQALEPVPKDTLKEEQTNSYEWLATEHFDRSPEVIYPDTEQLQEGQTPEVKVNWCHAYSAGGDRDPIVGYQIYSGDELDANQPHDGKDIEVNRLVTIRTVPWKMFRSIPATVLPERLGLGDKQEEPNPPDWVRKKEHIQLWRPDLCTPLPGSKKTHCDIHHRDILYFERDLIQSTPIWIFRPLVDVAEVIKKAIGKKITVDYLVDFPLEDHGRMVVANPVAEFEKLTKPPFDDQNDPFGWRTLERLGLSLSWLSGISRGRFLLKESTRYLCF